MVSASHRRATVDAASATGRSCPLLDRAARKPIDSNLIVGRYQRDGVPNAAPLPMRRSVAGVSGRGGAQSGARRCGWRIQSAADLTP